MWNQQRCDAFPWLRYSIDSYWQQLLTGLDFIVRHQNHTSTFSITLCCQFHSERGNASNRKDHRYVRVVRIQVWSMLEAGSSMRGCAEAAHFPNGKRTHVRGTICCTSPDYLQICSAAAEFF